MKKRILTILLATMGLIATAQQFDIGADIRSRFEYRNGFGNLTPDNHEAAAFITQRSRLNLDFKNNVLQLRVSPQNVRVWGDVATMATNDLNNSFHEAYAQVKLGKLVQIKAGRQELVYDDHRIFGNVDWAMQGRSHDVLLFKLNPDTIHDIHVGFALNANKESFFKENYLLPQYKAMQFLWYHGHFNHTGISFLLLNNGMPYLDGSIERVAYSQTIGPRFTYKKNNTNAEAAVYIQSGHLGVNKVKAYSFSGNLTYKPQTFISTGLGFEYLSGKSSNDESRDIKSFNPLYGTNHKFNGYMDYFYVGNHINNVGLVDIYCTLGFEKNKFSATLTPHYFAAAADLYGNGRKVDNYLGTEIDLTLGYKLFDYVNIQGGFSQMLATSSMEVLKGGNKSNGSNWLFLSAIINPKIFSHKAVSIKQ